MNGGEAAFEELLQLRQFANVESYQRRFQELTAIVNDLHEEFRVRCFTKGLRKEIKLGVEFYKSTTMDQAIRLAKLQEMTVEVVAMRSNNTGTLLPVNNPNTINATTTPIVPHTENVIREKIEHRESTLPVRLNVCESEPMVGGISNKETDEPKAKGELEGHFHGQNSAKNVFDDSEFEKWKMSSRNHVYEHAFDELIGLKQWGTVGEYRKRFLVLANKIEGLSEIFLVCCFECGLEEEIRAGVHPFQPYTLGQAMGLAMLQEMTLEALEKRSRTSKNSVSSGEKERKSAEATCAPTVQSIIKESEPLMGIYNSEGTDGLKSWCDSKRQIQENCSSEDVVKDFRIEVEELHLEEPEFRNEETNNELHLEFEFEKAVQTNQGDAVEYGTCFMAHLLGKLEIRLELFTVVQDLWVNFWVHIGNFEMASNTRPTGLINFFRKYVSSSNFWFVVDDIWDPGGHYQNIVLKATSKVANPTYKASLFSEITLEIEIFLFASSNSFCFLSILLIQNYCQTIRVLFLVEDWQFQFGLQTAMVTVCAKSGDGSCVCSCPYYKEASVVSEIGVHSLLDYNRRNVPNVVLYLSRANNILMILVGYVHCELVHLQTHKKFLASQNILKSLRMILDKFQSSIEYSTSHHCWLRAAFEHLKIRKPNYGLCPHYFLVHTSITIAPMFGNAVVLKPSEIAPATSSLLAKLCGEYLDSSAEKVVEGAVPETSTLLEQKWDKIFYARNRNVGCIVTAAAAKYLTPVTLGLGGKCPGIVDSDINLIVSARRIIAEKWGFNNGQACIPVDHIITTTDFAPKLIDTLKLELEQFFAQDPLKCEDLSRIGNSNHFARLTKLLDEDKVHFLKMLPGK